MHFTIRSFNFYKRLTLWNFTMVLMFMVKKIEPDFML